MITWTWSGVSHWSISLGRGISRSAITLNSRAISSFIQPSISCLHTLPSGLHVVPGIHGTSVVNAAKGNANFLGQHQPYCVGKYLISEAFDMSVTEVDASLARVDVSPRLHVRLLALRSVGFESSVMGYLLLRCQPRRWPLHALRVSAAL